MSDTLIFPQECNGQTAPCAMIQPGLELEKQCTIYHCCEDFFLQGVRLCQACIRDTLNVNNYTKSQAILDHHLQMCASVSDILFGRSSTFTTPPSTISDASATTKSPLSHESNNPRPTTTEFSVPPTTFKSRARVIGGAAAGSVALIALVALFLILRRKRVLKRRHHVESVISPYTGNSPTSEKRPRIKSSLTADFTEQATPPPSCEPSHSSDPAQRDAESSHRHSHHAPRIVVHEDSGWRPIHLPSSPSEISEVIEMPPQYDAAL